MTWGITMLEVIVKKYQARYDMLPDIEKCTLKKELDGSVERCMTVYMWLFIVLLMFSGILGWTVFIGEGQKYDLSRLTLGSKELPFLVFIPLLYIPMIAWARAAKNCIPMYVMFLLSIVGAVCTKGILLLLTIFCIYFITAEVKVKALSRLEGYPAFAEKQQAGYAQGLGFEQIAAIDRIEDRGLDSKAAQELKERILSGDEEALKELGIKQQSEEMDVLYVPEDIDMGESNVSKNS